MITFVDLVVFFAAVFGLSWGVAKAELTRPVRERFLLKIPFVRGMIECIVCTSFWVAWLWLLLAPWADVHSEAFQDQGWISRLVLVFAAVAATRVVARYVYKDPCCHAAVEHEAPGE